LPIAPIDEGEIKLTSLNPSFEAFGMVLDFLSAALPFSHFELGRFAGVIRQQLQIGNHLAALSRQNEMVGYAGWIHTSVAYATLWVEDKGSLLSLDGQPHDAAALTVVASQDKRATTMLLRGARVLNPGVRVYFKRGYDGDLRTAKKVSVLNVGNTLPAGQ
jgi:hypothetical protein